MSAIDLGNLDLENAQEPTAVPGNEEYELRILECQMKENKNGEPYLFPRFEVVGEPLAKDFSEYIPLPTNDMDAKKKERSRYRLKVFFQTFGIPLDSTVDVEDLQGATGWALLGVQNDEQYGEQNFVKKFLPRR